VLETRDIREQLCEALLFVDQQNFFYYQMLSLNNSFNPKQSGYVEFYFEYLSLAIAFAFLPYSYHLLFLLFFLFIS
jgi:hypothetical protein